MKTIKKTGRDSYDKKESEIGTRCCRLFIWLTFSKSDISIQILWSRCSIWCGKIESTKMLHSYWFETSLGRTKLSTFLNISNSWTLFSFIHNASWYRSLTTLSFESNSDSSALNDSNLIRSLSQFGLNYLFYFWCFWTWSFYFWVSSKWLMQMRVG